MATKLIDKVINTEYKYGALGPRLYFPLLKASARELG
jgi:hypothetical protein